MTAAGKRPHRTGATDGPPAAHEVTMDDDEKDRMIASLTAEVARLRALLLAARYTLSVLMDSLAAKLPPKAGW